MKPLDHKTIEQQELIERYVMKQLSQEEAEALEEHFFECDECFAKLKLTEKAISGIRLALKQKPSKHEPSFSQRFFTQPAFAIAAVVLVLLLIYPAFKGIWYQQQLQKFSKPNPIDLSFTLEESQVRSIDNIFLSRSPHKITIPPKTEFFTLSFSILENSIPKPLYRATILNEKKEIIWEIDQLQSKNEYGVFNLLCPRTFFKNGFYLLKVTELNQKKQPTGKVHFFPFEIVLE